MMDMEEDYINKFVRNNLKIPYCNLDGLSEKVQYEIITGLSFMYERYPFFNHVLCALEQENDFIYHYNMFVYTMVCDSIYDDSKICNDKRVSGFYSITDDHELTGYYELPKIIDDTFADYFSIVFFEGINKCNGMKIIFHEFGHLLDDFLHISNDKDFLGLINDKDLKSNDKEELVAELFSKYILSLIGYKNDIDELAYKVGNFIDKKYNLFVKDNIDNYYQFNLKYSICLRKKTC